MQNLAVYCGSSMGSDPAFAEIARQLGEKMASRNIDLVYGGGKLGLMGIIADTVLAEGGKVYGVIPDVLVGHEVAHPGLTELFTVPDMHQRKAKMTELTDAFIALPGGIGTLDELFEAWTWNALGYHAKPFGLLNVNNYWDSLVQFLDSVNANGFMSDARRKQLIVTNDIDEALETLKASCDQSERKVTW